MINKDSYYLGLLETDFKRMEAEVKNSDNPSFYNIINNNLSSFTVLFVEMNEENSKLRKELLSSIGINSENISIDLLDEFNIKVSKLSEDDSQELFIRVGQIAEKCRDNKV
jgi:hypothetical protein